MKRIILVLIVLILSSCEDKTVYLYEHITSNITNIRIDDDSEYHITYTKPNGEIISENDIDDYKLTVIRADVSIPTYTVYYRYTQEDLDSYKDIHLDIFISSKEIKIPINYKIETFDD